ncbi:N-formylglutamate amidohydrolase [Roseospira marina]|uniref:N-formylglutamate amidohydrolase n=1 Tax=Roseospira marina TaxID=140057 RepID=UPI00181572E2|nr:N-formylglutamate amidohydrolase [Roseospira marina]MBB4314509.1 putative N-formylglutamate amidohydrolase [Roseospira marina]MBB5088663.1 putative N-formylglutamate amidohydrolase [Roseospira marina]
MPGADDPPPFEVLNPDAQRPVLLICDHAGHRLPQALGTLGLDNADLHRHIAWDIGAAAVTRHLARRLDVCAVLATYSRLVIDLNRVPGAADSIPAVSDNTPVPGNQNLTEAEEEARITGLFHPYHAEITRRLHHLWRATGQAPVLFSIHSFTPTMTCGGPPRPWHIGVLWDSDGRLALPLMEGLAHDPDLIVGDNEPYSGWVVGYTVAAHAGSAGLARAAIEIRQDLIATEAGAADWAGRLASILEGILADPGLYVHLSDGGPDPSGSDGLE